MLRLTRSRLVAFATILTTALAPAALAGIDVEVTYIERTPKYFSYQDHVLYHLNVRFTDDYLPYNADVAYDVSQPPNTQRWPEPGEAVTFTAHVTNRGNAVTPGFDYRWLIDDQVVASGTYSQPLAPGNFVRFSTQWSWEFAPHRVRFETVVANDERPSNNAVEDFTNALSLFTFIDLGYARDFRDLTPQVPSPVTDSITEWLQHHRRRMNQMFEDAGSPIRIRYDRLDFVLDGQPLPQYDRANYDGNFPTRFRAGDPDLRLHAGYYDPDDDIDYGLLHEIGHQLGIIDLYRMDVAPSQNHVNGGGYSAPGGLMHGADHFISAHTAAAMERWHGFRRGYFGQYLYDLPETIRLRFLSARGEPLSDAGVTVYQKIITSGIGERIPNVPKFTGTTDAAGVFTLPNVPVNAWNGWTAVGNDLRPNPFGYISNHGANGVFLIRVEKNSQADYVWFDITEPNLAYWNGQTQEATFERETAIGEGQQNFPPLDLAENNAASWASWAEQGAIELFDDSARRRAGDASIRIEATGGFDNYVRYPGDTLARWDLSGVDAIRFSLYGANPNGPGFQSWSLRLGNHQEGWYQWTASSDRLNDALGRWVDYEVPIAGDATWVRTNFGTPDLSDMNYVQLNADTWGAGFTLWMDGIGFDPSPRPATGDMNCDGAVDAFDIEPFITALVDPTGYPALYPDCQLDLADVNDDGAVDAFDIEPFIALLVGP